MNLRCSRRELLALTGTAAAGYALAAATPSTGAAARGAATRRPGVSHFRSRPDLEPPIVDVSARTGPGGGVAGGGLVFVTPGGPLIVDGRGDPVWFRPARHYSTNLRVQHYQGQPVLAWWQGRVAPYGVAESGECVVVDAHYEEVARVKATNGLATDLHEFVIARDGTAYFTAYKVVTADLTPIGGPAVAKSLEAWIQGVDLATGAVVFEWRGLDHIDLTETYREYPPENKVFSPIHLNSIDPLPDGNLLVSARHTWTIYKVDGTTGAILWRLGGKKSDFTLGPGARFAWQHDARWHAGNVVSMFDNESAPPVGKQSRGLVLHVTETKRTVDLVHAYDYPGEELLAGAQGSVQFMPNGDVFVGWGLQPYFTQYRREGKVALSGRFASSKSYRAFRQTWTGLPSETPAVAVERRPGRVRVFASWNGATEVARWSVRGGSSRHSLSKLGTARRTGFETTIEVAAPANLRFFDVQALDRTGKVLATSPVRRF